MEYACIKVEMETDNRTSQTGRIPQSQDTKLPKVKVPLEIWKVEISNWEPQVPKKACVKCGICKVLSDFGHDSSAADEHLCWCKTCGNIEQAQIRIKMKKAWSKILPTRICQVCGYDKCEAAIEFHHRNPREKQFEISKWLAGHAATEKNKRILLTELAKCDILCCRCHRELHWYQNHPKEKTNG